MGNLTSTDYVIEKEGCAMGDYIISVSTLGLFDEIYKWLFG